MNVVEYLKQKKSLTRKIKTQLIKKRSPSQESQPLFSSVSSSHNIIDVKLKPSESTQKVDFSTANNKSLVILKVHNGEEYPIPKEK